MGRRTGDLAGGRGRRRTNDCKHVRLGAATSHTVSTNHEYPLIKLSTLRGAPRLVHIGLSELLVFTLREYEDLAVTLLSDPPRLARVREARR